MKIIMDAADIGKLAAAYCPQTVRYSGDTLLISVGDADFTLENTKLSLKTNVEYKNLTASLNCHLADGGAEITLDLK